MFEKFTFVGGGEIPFNNTKIEVIQGVIIGVKVFANRKAREIVFNAVFVVIESYPEGGRCLPHIVTVGAFGTHNKVNNIG